MARQVRTILSLSAVPSLAIDTITCTKDAGNFSGHTCMILRISRSAWIRSISLSIDMSNALSTWTFYKCVLQQERAIMHTNAHQHIQ